jgi:protein O-mannosyl-transferase
MSRRNALKKAAAAEQRAARGTSRSAGLASNSAGRTSRFGSLAAPVAVCFGLALAVAAIYAGTRHFEFVYFDDDTYVFENNHITSGLTRDNLVWAFTSIHSGYWHPLTSISHMLDAELYGDWAGGHHLTNVFIHAATAMVLFLSLRGLTGVLWPSALAAAVFALHPLRVESVAWVAERKDVLSGFFFSLTLLCYASYARRPSVFRYLLVALAFVLGLMSKPMVVTLPFVLLLLDYWPLQRLGRTADSQSAWRLVAEKAPLLAQALAFSAATVYTQDRAVKTMGDISVTARFSNAVVSYVAYLRQTFWPSDLAAYYPHPRDTLPGWQVIGAIALLIAITAAVVRGRRTRPYLLVGWLWYLGMLVPVIGLLQSGYQARADRFTYLPQIGLIVGLTWWVADLASSWKVESRFLGIASGILLFLLLATSWQQTHIWHDSITLFEHDLARTKRNYFIEYHLGITLGREGKLHDAVKHLGEAHRLNPDDFGVEYNYGVLLGRLELYKEAEHHLRRSAELDPTDFDAINHLGIVLHYLYRSANRKAFELAQTPTSTQREVDALQAEKAQLQDEAWSAFERARKLNPRAAAVYFNLGGIRFDQARYEEAIALYRQAIECDPEMDNAYASLGTAYYQANAMREALDVFREALRRRPDHLFCLRVAALAAATSPDPAARSGAEAVAWAERAAHLSEKDPQILGILAAAYAEVSRFDDAKKTAQRALDMAIEQNRPFDANKIRGHLALYEARMPVRETAQTPEKVIR